MSALSREIELGSGRARTVGDYGVDPAGDDGRGDQEGRELGSLGQ